MPGNLPSPVGNLDRPSREGIGEGRDECAAQGAEIRSVENFKMLPFRRGRGQSVGCELNNAKGELFENAVAGGDRTSERRKLAIYIFVCVNQLLL